MVPTMKDSRGRESTTLTIVVACIAPVWLKFTFAGFTLPYLGQVPSMSAIDFGVAVTGLLGIWLGREWTEKRGADAP